MNDPTTTHIFMFSTVILLIGLGVTCLLFTIETLFEIDPFKTITAFFRDLRTRAAAQRRPSALSSREESSSYQAALKGTRYDTKQRASDRRTTCYCTHWR